MINPPPVYYTIFMDRIELLSINLYVYLDKIIKSNSSEINNKNLLKIRAIK